MKNKIVLSGVNMTEGGILTVFKQVIKAFASYKEFELICLVHDKSLFPEFLEQENIKFIIFKDIKKSWLSRVYFEYIYSWWLSKKIRPQLWLCLHDISANLYKTPQFVYCHNPSAFYKADANDWRLDKKFFLFTKFYKFLYKINIKSNVNVIVQQGWIADSFSKWFGINNLLVARPVSEVNSEFQNQIHSSKKEIVFLYPAIPRVFKNFEIIIAAVTLLKEKHPEVYKKIRIKFTFSEGMNKYGDQLVQNCKNYNLEVIEFIGFQTKQELDSLYANKFDFLIFPSKLETWGLPLSEAKHYGLPILAADLPYAHETVGAYSGCIYFDPNNVERLARIMIDCISDTQAYVLNPASVPCRWPVIHDWNLLADYLVEKTK